MAGNDSGLVGQGEKAGVDGVDDLLGIAAWKVGATDASREESVASEDHLQRREIKTDGTLGVTWSVDNSGGVVVEADMTSIRETFVGRSGFRGFDAQPGCLSRHHMEERKVIFVEEDRRSGEGFELECAANVIDVGVGDEDLLEGETESGEAAMNAVDIIARVDDDGFTGFLVAQDGAVALQWADGEGLEDHGFIVERRPQVKTHPSAAQGTRMIGFKRTNKCCEKGLTARLYCWLSSNFVSKLAEAPSSLILTWPFSLPVTSGPDEPCMRLSSVE